MPSITIGDCCCFFVFGLWRQRRCKRFLSLLARWPPPRRVIRRPVRRDSVRKAGNRIDSVYQRHCISVIAISQLTQLIPNIYESSPVPAIDESRLRTYRIPITDISLRSQSKAYSHAAKRWWWMMTMMMLSYPLETQVTVKTVHGGTTDPSLFFKGTLPDTGLSDQYCFGTSPRQIVLPR